MRYKTFGRQVGLRVSSLGLGTANWGPRWGSGADRDEAQRIFTRFAEAGGTLVDTADSYQFGGSEVLLGDFLASERDRFVLTSKFTYGSVADGGASMTGNSRKNMIRSVEASLRRLKTDRIDLYLVHFPDGLTPLEEIVRGLDDLVRAGKILYGGLSNFSAWATSRAATLAELRGLSPIAGIQVEYSLVERTPDRELVPMAEGLGLGVALWSPVGGGLLTGKYRISDEGRLTSWKRLVHTESDPQKTAIVDEVIAIADELGCAPAHVSVAWLLHRDGRSTTSLVPIIGPRTLEQLDDYLAALTVELSDEQYARLTDVSAVPLGVPHDMVDQWLANMVAGGDASAFDQPAIRVS